MKLIQEIVFTILVLLNVVFEGSGVLEEEEIIINQSQMKNARRLIQDEDFLASPGQVFGTCYKMTLLPGKIQVDCTFIMETNENVYSTDHLRICNFTLKSFTNHYKKNYYIPRKVTAIDENKAFLSMAYRKQKAFYILHFADCSFVEVDLEVKYARVAAPQDDVFDIIVTKDERAVCNSKYCRMVLDTQGKVITGMYGWLHEDSEIIAVAPATLKERVVVDKPHKHWKTRDDGLVRIYSVERGGIINISKQYQAQAGPGVHYGAITASTTHRFLTVCSTNKKSLTYAQFDWNSNLIFDGVWKNDKIDLFHTLRVHNLPNGGFLLVMTLCYKENNIKKCEKNNDIIFVKKFDEFGREFGTLNITDWKHTDNKKIHFYVTDEQKMCLSDVNGYYGNIYLNVVCFKDADFANIFL